MTDQIQAFWESVYKENIGKMTGICYRYTGDREIAGDLAHDAFLTAIHKLPGFEGKGPLEAWLWRITVNVALQHLREQKKKKYVDDWTAYTTEMMEDNLEQEDDGFSEEELLEAVGRLPEHHRFVFNLYVIDGFTHAQIAAELGISEGTSKSHLARGRKKIREVLAEKLKEKQKERKFAFLFLFLFKLKGPDRLYRYKFRKFEIQSLSERKPGSFDFSGMTVPATGSSLVHSINWLKTGIVAGGVASGFLLLLYLPQKEKIIDDRLMPVSYPQAKQEDRWPVKTRQIAEEDAAAGDIVQNEFFSDSIGATIPEKGIMLSENINKIDNMKSIKTLGAMLVAGSTLAFDSIGQTRQNTLPLTIEDQESGNMISLNQPDKKKVTGGYPSGTFYAEKLSWSSADNELRFNGKVVVNIGDNNFIGNGTSTFLGKVYYLVFENTPVKINSTLKLTEKKYALKSLPPQKAMEKYGENGRNGAVEISLAD